MGRIFQKKKGSTWQCWYYDPDGRRVKRSTYCKDRYAAELVLRRLERDAHDPKSLSEDKAPYTVSKALLDLLNRGCQEIRPATLSMYMQKAGHVDRLLGERQLHELQDISLMQGYIRQRQKDGAARGTIHKEIITVRKTLQFALEAKRIDFDPRVCFPKFRVKYVPRDRWLTPEEVLKLLQVLPPHRQLWVALAVYTGGRDSEVDCLEWRDLDWNNKVIHIRGTKTDGSDRVIPMLPVLQEVLRKSRGSMGPIVGEWRNVRRDLHAACSKDRANIPPCSPNDLRRTFASWLVNQGVATNVVAEMMGHKSTRMVEQVYGKIHQDVLRYEISKLGGGWDTLGTKSGSVMPPESPVSQSELRKLSEILGSAVLGDRIELSTRGELTTLVRNAGVDR